MKKHTQKQRRHNNKQREDRFIWKRLAEKKNKKQKNETQQQKAKKPKNKNKNTKTYDDTRIRSWDA